jgi:hypothetical protein
MDFDVLCELWYKFQERPRPGRALNKARNRTGQPKMVFDRLLTERELIFEIKKQAVYSHLGYRNRQTVLSEKMKTLVDKVFSEAIELIEPLGVYIARRIKEKARVITFVNSDIVIESSSVSKLLSGSFGAIFMAVTIGPALERKIDDEIKEHNNEKALVFDAVGSGSAEAAANALNNHLITQSRQAKLFLTTRFSPGYGDLPLTFQRDLYRELSLDELGIRITEKCILYPQKTITAVIGVEQ